MGTGITYALMRPAIASYQPRPPEWPVVLRVDRGRAWAGSCIAVGLVGWVFYDWWDTRQFDWAADLTRLLFGAILGIASTHWMSGKITVTPDEIREESLVSKKQYSMLEVASAKVEIVRGNGPKKPLIGSKLVLRNAAGKEAYSFPEMLTPAEKLCDLSEYLLRRFGAE